jgi:Transposase DDE domain group 1
MGEAKRRQEIALNAVLEPILVDTPGGRIHVQWDHNASATANAQLAFFAEFLVATGLYKSWLATCPLSYTSPNAPDKADVLGTWMLSILAGHKRYAHVTALRGDLVSTQILGMKKIISEDSLRRALARMSIEQSKAWLCPQLIASVQGALNLPWILDIDTTIKPLYGKQEGAEIGYNPHKPGRPSHALHTYLVGNLRLVLDAVVTSGNESSSASSRPGLIEVLEALTPKQQPTLVRGDCGFGNEPFIIALEQRSQAYLFKMRKSPFVQRLLARNFNSPDWTEPGAGDQGWSAMEDTIKLAGWKMARRVVLLRRPIKLDLALSQQVPTQSGEQAELFFPGKDTRTWEYATLVTNSTYEPQTIAQLYRDRADAENSFDELKNQWGWGGFTTQDMGRCQSSARAVALIYNWWSWYCRAANPSARMEAITSRALLLAGVGKAVSHAGQTTLYLTSMHGAKDKLMALVGNIRQALLHVKTIAEQLPSVSRWQTFIDYVITRFIRQPPCWQRNKCVELLGN